MGMISCVRLSIIIGWFICLNIAYTAPISLKTTKENLAEIEKKIHQMQQRLTQVQDKQTLIKQELANTEKRINQARSQLHETQKQYAFKQREITQLETEQQPLNEQYQQLKTSLANTLVSRYKMADKKAIISILQQQDPQMINRLWVYYRYLLRANQHLMDQLKAIQHNLNAKKETLNHELATLAALQQKLKHHQDILEAEQRYRTALLKTLSQDFHQTQEHLETFRQSQAHLTKLLTTLNQQSVLQTRHPLSQMKRKLTRPLQMYSSAHRLNQGILFTAPEGTQIQAVFPGKIVFSDWLNAYGLLIIIDHGWGFMTLYANNQTVFKHKGDMVSQGEKIAIVGHSGTFRQNGLYFEIRHRGKTIPPLEWLK